MPKAKLRLVPSEADTLVDLNAVFNSLDMAILVLGPSGEVLDVNLATEQLVGKSAEALLGKVLSHVSPMLCDIQALAKSAGDRGIVVSEHGLEIVLPGQREHAIVDVAASPLSEPDGCVVVRMLETTVSQSMDRRLGFLGAAISVSGMASVLAHEIKNPLSGIRGASQLLDQHVSESDKALTDLIRDEVDRICALVDRMGQFSNKSELHPAALNIHKVLDRVHKLAESGFATHVSFATDYDPSLPPVSGDRDLLIQVFLNLIKNAAEATPLKKAKIVLRTSYLSGVRLVSLSPEAARTLPICVEISDNGTGISSDMREHLFDPFVTSKPNGSGLGLALTAKTIQDHGGMIDFDTSTNGTTFRVLLPTHVENIGKVR